VRQQNNVNLKIARDTQTQLFVSDKMKYLEKSVVFVVISSIFFAAWHFQSFDGPTATEVTLKDILNCELLETSMRDNMFFIESSGSNGSEAIRPASLTSREACAIESAATKNPNLNVFMIFVGKTHLVDSKQIRVLKTFDNVHFVRLDVVPFSTNTPMGKWIESGKLFDSRFIKWNLSNALRLLLLWK
jgi:hypothetical protein